MAVDNVSVDWNNAVEAALLEQAGAEAVAIAAERIATAAVRMTGSLKTAPPGRSEWGYSMPPGRLRQSIHVERGQDGLGPYADVMAIHGLGIWRNLGGGLPGVHSEAAYGGSRGNWRTITKATLEQVGRPIP